MLTITNGRDIIMVTRGAYAALYKHQGYTVVSGEGGSTPPPNPGDEAESSQAKITPNGSEDEGVTLPTGKSKVDSSSTNPGEYAAEDEEEEEEVDLSEIPLAEMTRSQLLEYADQLGVEYTGEETKRKLRELIRAVL